MTEYHWTAIATEGKQPRSKQLADTCRVTSPHTYSLVRKVDAPGTALNRQFLGSLVARRWCERKAGAWRRGVDHPFVRERNEALLVMKHYPA